MCELPAEVSEVSEEVSGRKETGERRSHLNHDCANGVVRLEVDDIFGFKEEKGRKEALAGKEPPYTSNGDEK